MTKAESQPQRPATRSQYRVSTRGLGLSVIARFEVPDGRVAQSDQFALDPTPHQTRMVESRCEALLFVRDHMLAHVKAILDQRAAERGYGLSIDELIRHDDRAHLTEVRR